MSNDQRPIWERFAPDPCPTAAGLLDRTLAIVLTDRDSDEDLLRYAHTIQREAHRWID